jgi:hypothetical protein
MPLSKIPYLLFILFVFLQTSFPAFAQTNSLPLDKWVENLDADDDTPNKKFTDIVEVFKSMDTTIFF